MKQFGETVPGYNIPVLNEREIKASAGIFFVGIFTAILNRDWNWFNIELGQLAVWIAAFLTSLKNLSRQEDLFPEEHL